MEASTVFLNPEPTVVYSLPKFEDMYKTSAKILLTGYEIDYESQQFLADNPDIPFEIPKVTETVHKVFRSEIFPSFELITDEESNLVKRLAITFTIPGKEYGEILKMWTQVSKDLYREMDPSTAKKIAILIDGD